MYVAMEHGALGAPAAHQRGDYLADRPGSVLPAQSRWPLCSLGLCVHVHTCLVVSGLCSSRTSLLVFIWYFSGSPYAWSL